MEQLHAIWDFENGLRIDSHDIYIFETKDLMIGLVQRIVYLWLE